MDTNKTLQQAIDLFSQGNLQSANNLLEQLLSTMPKHPEANHILGLINNSLGKTEEAIKLIERAINNSNDNFLFYSNCGEIYRSINNISKAIEYGEKAVELNSNYPAALSNLGLAYYDNEEYDKALNYHEQTLALAPNFISSLNNIGSIAQKQKDLKKAEEYYNKVISIDPNYLEAYNNLGAALTQIDKPEEAIKALNKAIDRNPSYTEALCNMGIAFTSLEKFNDAIEYFNKALQLRPEYIEAILGKAVSYKEINNYEEAEQLAKKALGLEHNNADTHVILGSIYGLQNKFDLEKEHFNTALEIDPENYSALLWKANLYTEEGLLNKAEDILQYVFDNSLTEKKPALFNLVNLKKVTPDSNLVHLIEEAKKQGSNLPANKTMDMCFALGKMYEDIGDADKAFTNFAEACGLYRSQIDYSSGQRNIDNNKIKSTFTKEFIEKYKGLSNKSISPIFILGMPRSGTTLVEQIISSHPTVHGAGELEYIQNLVRDNKIITSFIDNSENFVTEKINDIASQYLKETKALAPNSLHIIDKMPANFFYLGLIYLLFPNAKIIHTKRYPLATCTSNFTRHFKKGRQHHSYDLMELGYFYKGYEDLINHWKKVLPENSFYEIKHEDLVENQEDEIRKLIEYCDLEWNDNCLEFYKNKRPVKTASVTQVRQPIYKSSVNKWKMYEEYLKPLITVLGDDSLNNYS